MKYTFRERNAVDIIMQKTFRFTFYGLESAEAEKTDQHKRHTPNLYVDCARWREI